MMVVNPIIINNLEIYFVFHPIILLASMEGIEPSLVDLETTVLPLHYTLVQNLEPLAGFAPATYGLQNRCSTN